MEKLKAGFGILRDKLGAAFGRLSRKSRRALAILVGAFVIFFLMVATKPSANVEPAEEPIFAVRTLEVTPQALSPAVTLYGRVISPSRAQLTAAVVANVLAVPVRPGDRVPAGTVLVQLDPEEAEIALEQAQSSLQQADASVQLELARQKVETQALAHQRELLRLRQNELNRAKNLQAKGLLSDADLDQVRQNLRQQSLSTEQAELAVEQGTARLAQLQAQRASAEASLRRAELDLDRTAVKVGFDAAIIDVAVAPGDRVTIGQPLLQLYDSAALEVRAQIPGRYLDGVRRGLADAAPITAEVRSGGRSYPARLARLASSGGAGGVNGYFTVDRPGLEVDSNVQIAMQLPVEENSVPLPFEAIYELSRIYRFREGRLDGVTVERLGDYYGPGGEQLVLVRSPRLEAGDRVVVTNLPNAVQGLRVQVID